MPSWLADGSIGLDLTDPVAVALAGLRALRRVGIDAALYGGLALAAYGAPRETNDADFAVAGAGGRDGAAALVGLGPDVALAFDRVRFGGLLVSRITLLPGGGTTGLNLVGLVEPRSPRLARAALDRAITGTLRGETIRVLSPEDFVLFKVLSTRDRDLEDAATVLRGLGSNIDHALIEREAAALATEIPDHDVSGRLARVHLPG